jgi:hypothetical protein
MPENMVLYTAVYKNVTDAVDDLHALEQSSDEAGLIVVGEPTLEKGFDEAITRTARIVKRSVDAKTDELASELQEALRSEG